jgi:hypothetical protein
MPEIDNGSVLRRAAFKKEIIIKKT